MPSEKNFSCILSEKMDKLGSCGHGPRWNNAKITSKPKNKTKYLYLNNLLIICCAVMIYRRAFFIHFFNRIIAFTKTKNPV